jgi:hypothetical protein
VTREERQYERAAVQVSRDPFARADFMREKCDKGQECAWCGQPARFSYYWQGDSVYRSARIGGSLQFEAKVFCSVDCYRTYNS